METPPPQPSDADESPAQRQARLRRERRQAKIAAEGSSRLAKITGIEGRRGAPALDGVSSRPASRAGGASGTSSPAPEREAQAAAEVATPDPEEGDVGHLVAAAQQQRGGARRPAPAQRQPSNGFDFGHPAGGGAEDPMRLIVQQLLGGAPAPGTPDGTSSPAGPPSAQFPPGMLPPALARLLDALPEDRPGAAAPGGGGFGGRAESPRTASAASWRVLHAAASLLLALYVTLTLDGGFAGTKAARQAAAAAGSFAEAAPSSHADVGRRLFLWFATVEVVLQSGRFFLERGQLPKTGLLGTLAAFVPEPFAGYLRVVGRYNVIFSTLLQDALVIIFVLGLMVWWNGFAGAVESR
jgi:hypothetical protein